MPTKEEDGTYRARKKTPGYGNGTLIMRLGTRDKKIAQEREKLLVGLYEKGYYDVIDAIRARKITFVETATIMDESGMPGIRESLAKQASPATESDAYALAQEWRDSRTGDITKKQQDQCYNQVIHFLNAVKALKNAKGDSVSVATLTKENLKSYRDSEEERRIPDALLRAKRLRVAQGVKLSKKDIEALEREVAGSVRATVNRHVNSVGSFGTWLVERKLLSVSPAIGVRRSTKNENRTRSKKYRYLRAGDVKVLLNAARAISRERGLSMHTSQPDDEFLEYLVSTGARVLTEGTKVTIEDLDMDSANPQAGTVRVYLAGTKTEDGSRRHVEISVHLAQRLVNRAKRLKLSRTSLLFPFDDKDYMPFWKDVLGRVRSVNHEVWERIAAAMPKDLSHTFAVNAILNGVDIVRLKELMGHENIATTMIYAKHVQPATPALSAMAAQFGIADTQ